MRECPEPPKAAVERDTEGAYVLTPDHANLPEGDVSVESKDGIPNLGYLLSPDSAVTWTVDIAEPGDYNLSGSFAIESGGSSLNIQIGTAS